MHFNLHIELNDKDYLDYNTFWAIKSPYGKNQILWLRVFVAVLFAAFSFFSLLAKGFSTSAWLGIIPYLVVAVAIELFLGKFFTLVLKSHIKSLKSKGKMGYSPVSDMEFFDECFTETTPNNKTEQKYSSIERVSVVGGNIIYIHVNSIMAYILPLSSFNSKEQLDAFLEFIKTKCPIIDTYC